MSHIKGVSPFLRSAVVSLGVLLPPPSLGAQPVVDTTSVRADSAQLATITTDTGAFAPGHRDFSRYDTPGLCRAAARVTRASFELSLEAQATGDTLSEDTIGVGATAPVARACGARFTLASATAREIDDLFDLALQEQDDALAQAVLAKIVAQDTTEEEREDSWSNAMIWYLGFGRLAAADALMAQIEAHGAVPPATLLRMHALLGGYFDRSGDTVRFRRELNQTIALGDKGPLNGKFYSFVESAYQNLMRLAVMGHPDAMLAVAQQAKRDLSRFSNDSGMVADNVRILAWGRMSLDTVINHLAPTWYTYRRHSGAAVAPHLQADYWFPAPGHAASDTVVPVRGKVNLICLGGATTNAWLDVFNKKPLFSGYQQAAHIRSWLTRYGAAGLEVTIVRLASGYVYINYPFRQQEVKWFQTPAEEAQLWRWYAQEYEQLPVTVAVQVRHAQWLPQPDGRRWSESAAQFIQYQTEHARKYPHSAGYHPGACTIIGRDGVVLYSSDGGGSGDQESNHDIGVVLRWLFQGPGASLASAVPMSSVPRASLPIASDSSPHPPQGSSP